MDLEVTPGRYIVAVSGGVDSMVLLDLLRQKPEVELVVAHFDHGIRSDSIKDRKLVQKTAARHSLPFVYGTGKLGGDTSEAVARKARYDFLDRTKREYGAAAVITAHHQDDVLETAAINLLRGTNRRGLSSLKSDSTIVRPLLAYSKSDLKSYAKKHKVEWLEDSTNASDAYLRNVIRRRFARSLSKERRAKLLTVLKRASTANAKIELLLMAELARITDKDGIRRAEFNKLNHTLAKEIMATWLRQDGIRDYDKKLLERLVVAAKVAKPGNTFDVLRGNKMHVTEQHLALEHKQR